MSKIGIVGSEVSKFTAETEEKALKLIYNILSAERDPILVSGHCHLGGIDIYAEEVADANGWRKQIFPPKVHSWSDGYKPRNIRIAEESDVVHCITVKTLPDGYSGMRFRSCYHCDTDEHVKSGGCWTVKEARKLGKQGYVHVIS